jgi:hypothetical protein
MTPEVASLLLRCLAAMAEEGIGPRSYNWTSSDEYPGDDQLYAQAVKVVGGENVSHWELLEIVHDLREKGLL